VGEDLIKPVALGRKPVEFGTVRAVAGVVERDGKLEIAFRGPLRQLSRASTGTVDGQAVRVVSPFVVSSVLAGLVEATVELIGNSEAGEA
jgi:NADH:ubiquinone oxidoreductase subunit F (NADH-binding)